MEPADPFQLCGREPIRGRYLAERLLGAGGMGVVYQALDLKLNRPCALKLLRSHDVSPKVLPELLRRFQREANVSRRLRHAGLVAAFDAGKLDDGTPFFAMELLSGRSLSEVLHQGGPLPWQEAVEVGLQAAEALSTLHLARVVHRDLKPANLQLLDSGQLKVLDFGIVHADYVAAGEHDLTDVPTRTNQQLGTPSYMAPEQILDSKRVDARTDIYSLALVLFELMTGEQPFRGLLYHEVQQLKFVPRPVPPLRQHLPAAPAPLESLLLSALGQRDGRPASMEVVAATLRELLGEDRALVRERLAARAQRSPPTPLPLWGEGVAETELEAPTAFAPTQLAGGPMPVISGPIPVAPSQWGRRILGPGAVLLSGLLAAAWWSHPRPRTIAPAAAPPPVSPAMHQTAQVAAQGPAAPVAVHRRAPVASPLASKGTLRVAVLPFAQIYIDGSHRQEGSPHTYVLPVGRHAIRALNPALGRDETRDVRVQPGPNRDLRIDWSAP